jgi:hypothetical protein
MDWSFLLLAGSPMRRFTTHCDAAFAPLLSRHGFTRVARKVDRSLAEHVYRAGGRYVKVTASDDPRDGPSHCQVLLGEGSNAWPETDWNTVALWQLGRAHFPAEAPAIVEEYEFAGVDGLAEALRRASVDLERFGAAFLADDLRGFRELRAAISRTRSPYKIHSPGSDGGYVTREDPESAELKRRYSQVEPDRPDNA